MNDKKPSIWFNFCVFQGTNLQRIIKGMREPFFPVQPCTGGSKEALFLTFPMGKFFVEKIINVKAI